MLIKKVTQDYGYKLDLLYYDHDIFIVLYPDNPTPLILKLIEDWWYI